MASGLLPAAISVMRFSAAKWNATNFPWPPLEIKPRFRSVASATPCTRSMPPISADQFSGVDIHHHDAIRARDISPARVRIDGKVIPTSAAAEWQSLNDFVGRRGCNLCGGETAKRNQRQAKQHSHACQALRFL